MAALAKDVNVNSKDAGRSIDVPLAATTTVYAGGMISANASGFGIPAADTASTTVIGIAEEGVVNSGAAGAKFVRVRKGTFELKTTGGNAVTQADVGLKVFVLDDANVVKAAGATNDVIAGTLDSLDQKTGRPWVRIQDAAGGI